MSPTNNENVTADSLKKKYLQNRKKVTKLFLLLYLVTIQLKTQKSGKCQVVHTKLWWNQLPVQAHRT